MYLNGQQLIYGPNFGAKMPPPKDSTRKMSTKFLHTFRAGVGFVCVSQVTEACAQLMASLHPSACSALSIIGTDIDIEEF